MVFFSITYVRSDGSVGESAPEGGPPEDSNAEPEPESEPRPEPESEPRPEPKPENANDVINMPETFPLPEGKPSFESNTNSSLSPPSKGNNGCNHINLLTVLMVFSMILAIFNVV